MCNPHAISHTIAPQGRVSFEHLGENITCTPSFVLINDVKDCALKRKDKQTMQYTQYVKASAVCDMVPGEKNDLNSNQVVDYNNTGLKVNMDQLYKTVDFKFQAGADVSRIANMGSCATWEIGGGLDYGFVNTNKKEFNHAVGVNAKAGVDLYLTSKIKAIVTAGVKATCSVDGKPLDADLFSCVKTKNDKIGYTYGGSAALQFANIANLKFSVFAVQGENGKQVPAGQISLILGFNEDCD